MAESSFHGPIHGHNVVAGISVSGDGRFTAHFHETRQSQCLADLRLTDPRHDKKRIERTKGGLIRPLCQWVIKNEDFKAWRENGQRPLLWIKGEPGKGKTMLLCSIVDELSNSFDETGGPVYFFCQAADPKLNNATAILRGLIYFILTLQPSLISHIQERYEQAGKKLFEDVNAWVALSEIMTSMLQDSSVENQVVIIDALDECVHGLNDLLELISSLVNSSKTQWIVSSRHWQDIEDVLEPIPNKITLSLESNESSISQATYAYVELMVERLSNLKKYDHNVRCQVHDHLVLNCNNTFLWVSLVCQELANPKVKSRHTLKILNTFPSGLESLYRRMLSLIFDSYDVEICKSILATVSAILRPVNIKELASLIKPLGNYMDDLDTLIEIINACGSFLVIREQTVYFVHQSAKDFIINRTANNILPNGVRYEHRTIFFTSLEILNETLRRDVYDLKSPGSLVEEISTPDPDPLAPANYACVFWVDHFQYSDMLLKPDECVAATSSIYNFIRHKFLYWLEALSLLGHVSDGITAIQTLERLVTKMTVSDDNLKPA